MNDDKRILLEQTVTAGLNKALSRAPAPPVIGALLSLGWDGTSLARWMQLSEGRISQWLGGHTGIPSKHNVKLHYLLAQTLAEYDRRIEELQAEGLWTMAASVWLRYRTANARSTLGRYRKRARLPRKAA